MHPLQYAADCEAILGYTLPHDDSVNDRSDGSKLNNAHEITVRLWNEAFGKSFAKPGAMFRGDPPNGKLWPIKQEHLTQMLSFSRFNVRIARLEIRLAPSPIIETKYCYSRTCIAVQSSGQIERRSPSPSFGQDMAMGA